MAIGMPMAMAGFPPAATAYSPRAEAVSLSGSRLSGAGIGGSLLPPAQSDRLGRGGEAEGEDA